MASPVCPICCEDVNDDTVLLPCDPIVPHIYHKRCILINIKFLYDKDVTNTDFACAICRKNYQYKEINGHTVTFDQVFDTYKYWSFYVAILIFIVPASFAIHGYVFYDMIFKHINTMLVFDTAISVMLHLIYAGCIWQCLYVRHQVYNKNYNNLIEYVVPEHIKCIPVMIIFFIPSFVLLGLYLVFPNIYTLSGCMLITILLWMSLPFCIAGQSTMLNHWLNRIMHNRAKLIKSDLLPIFVLNVNDLMQESNV